MKKYIELKKNPAATHLCVETYYDLGGTSWSTGRIKERGYYLRVKPVTKETRHGTGYGLTMISHAMPIWYSVSVMPL